jgi:ABC-type transport system involved in cytochrome c biogenesis permease subunit
MIPAVLASVALGAHLLRGGSVALAIVVVLLPLLVLARRSWAVRVIQGTLAAGVVVWIHTLVVLTAERRAQGIPSLRMGVILGVVALVTALGAILLEPLACRFRAAPSRPKEP